MRIIGMLAIMTLSACSVENITDRNSGVGFSNDSVPAETSAQPAGETDYRGQLFEELGDS